MNDDLERDLHLEKVREMHAKELLSNPVMQEALEAIRREIVDQWEAAPIRDKDGKEALWQLYKVTAKFEATLKGYIESGKLATERLRVEEGRMAKVRQFLNRA